MVNRAFFTTLLVALSLTSASSAFASSAYIENGTLRYVGGSEEVNDVGLRVTETNEYELYDNSAFAVYKRDRILVKPGNGCRYQDPTTTRTPVLCQMTGVTRVLISLKDRNDAFRHIAPIPVPVTYAGGSGLDSVSYNTTATPETGTVVSADGIANDGPDAQDNVLTDVERIYGRSTADQLTGSPLRSYLIGFDGDDQLRGGAGRDRIEAAEIGDVGEDTGIFDAEGADTVSCGRGNDQVFHSLDDVISADCEVRGYPVDDDTKYEYTFRGSNSSDSIFVWSFFANDVLVRGRGGNDRIASRSQGTYQGHSGADVIRGSYGVDRFEGGSGNDRLFTREKTSAYPAQRDLVYCGTGYDRVYADTKDRVSRSCEAVYRK